MKDVTIILIGYKSDAKIKTFIEKVPNNLKILIVDNSSNYDFKKKIEKNYKNISIFLKNNNGVSSSLNFAVEKIKTKYFLQISPDIAFDFKDLDIFLSLAKKLDDKFAAIGPRFKYVNEKSHKQINQSLEYGSINSIHGSCMFINKECFKKIGKFDENIFLYFEETEYCFRGKKNNYLSYQTNKINVYSTGRSLNDNEYEKKSISNLLVWHFIWSKFYFSKKKYGMTTSLILFIPILFRINFKIFLNKFTGNKEKLEKYRIRLDGLIKSIKGEKSILRPE